MIGRCAKKIVVCKIVLTNGTEFIGTNDCFNPQFQCPRFPGDNYSKCRSICNQLGHAEQVALYKAIGAFTYWEEVLKGAKAYIKGISWVCRQCQEVLYQHGIESISIVKEF